MVISPLGSGRASVVLGLSIPGGDLAGRRVDDGLSGCAGHRVARCGDWRDSGIRRLSQSAAAPSPDRSTAGFVVAVVIMFLVGGRNSVGGAVLRRGRLHADHGHGSGDSQAHQSNLHWLASARWGVLGASFAAALAALVFVGQIVGKWNEGGWVVLIHFQHADRCWRTLLLVVADRLSRTEADSSHRARQGARARHMASIVEWQSLKMQEYRYQLLLRILIGVTRVLSCSACDGRYAMSRARRRR